MLPNVYVRSCVVELKKLSVVQREDWNSWLLRIFGKLICKFTTMWDGSFVLDFEIIKKK